MGMSIGKVLKNIFLIDLNKHSKQIGNVILCYYIDFSHGDILFGVLSGDVNCNFAASDLTRWV